MLRDLRDMLGSMLRITFVIVGLGLILYLVIGAVQCHGFAAPIPPPPRRMQAEDLPGRWRYGWGDMKDGQIVFQADGFYYSRHENQNWEARYCGRWKLDGNELILHERLADSCSVGCVDYRITLSQSMPGYAMGKYHETLVVLSNRRRE